MEGFRHNDKGVEFNASFGALVLQDVDEEQGGLFDLKEATARGGDRRDEIGANLLRGRAEGYNGPGLKPLLYLWPYS